MFKRIKRKYVPILLVECYLLVTLLLYWLGPFEYNDDNLLGVVLLVGIYQLSLYFGYQFSSNKEVRKISSSWSNFLGKKMHLFITVALLLSSFYALMTIVRYCNSFSPDDLINAVLNGISNPKAVYLNNMKLNNSELIGGSLITITSTLFSSFYFIGIPLGVYYFEKLNKKSRILLIITILLEISSYIVKGTNIGIFKTGIIILTVGALNYDFSKLKRINWRSNKIRIATITLLFMLIYFIFSVSSRMGGANTQIASLHHVEINYNNIIIKFLPSIFVLPIILIISYVSQGYHGLALSLNAEFSSTFGVGSSQFLIENFSQLLNIDIMSYTYPAKISDIWDARVNWHTIYTWIANDVSFLGVIFVMFLLGYIIYKIFYDAYINRNVIAICLIPLYILMILFIPANNFVISNPLTFMPFVTLHIAWIITKYTNYHRRKKYG